LRAFTAAIELAIGHADPQEVLVVAGKGAEGYQEVSGRRHPFSRRRGGQGPHYDQV